MKFSWYANYFYMITKKNCQIIIHEWKLNSNNPEHANDTLQETIYNN